MEQQVLTLGKQIVQELKLDPGVDTLSKWMVHYLAEKIVVAESLEGVKKAAAGQECFELINEIWRHRWSLPEHDPILSNFEPLVKTLRKLNPDQSQPLYSFPEIMFRLPESSSERDAAGRKLKSKFEAALKVDRLARTLIHDLLQQGVADIELSEDRWALIQNAIKLFETPDTATINFYTDSKYLREVAEPDEREEVKEEIKECIAALEAFDLIKDELIRDYQLKLKGL